MAREQRSGKGLGDSGSLTTWIFSDNSFRDCPQKCRSIPWELRFITWGIWWETKSQDAGLIRCFQGKHRYKERLNTICSLFFRLIQALVLFLKSCPVIPVAAAGALKCRKRRTFFMQLGSVFIKELNLHQARNPWIVQYGISDIIPLNLLQWLYMVEKPSGFWSGQECWGLRKRQTLTCDILPLTFLVLAFQWTKEGGRWCRGKRESEGIRRKQCGEVDGERESRV